MDALTTNSKSILFAEKHSAEAEAAAAEMGIQFAHGAIDVLGGPVGTQEDSKSIVRASRECQYYCIEESWNPVNIV